LLFSFSETKTPEKIDYIYTSCFIITIIVPVLINLYLLIPFFLAKEKYVSFGVLFVVNLLLFTQLNAWLFTSFIDVVFPEYYFVSYHENTTLFLIFSVFLVATTLVRLSENWIRLNKVKNDVLKNENIEIQNQLTSLKSQINPHFLFNSLNVLYSLSLDKKKETPSAILQLSHILRYVLYDTDRKHISLDKEIELIHQYLAFQKFRTHDASIVSFEADVDDGTHKIQPMLLLPLIENSFKHGIKGEIENTFINIKMTKNNNEFLFYIENNVSQGPSIEDKEYSGLGLKNIQQNLNLVYPNNHSFEIEKTTDTFAVSLKINLNDR